MVSDHILFSIFSQIAALGTCTMYHQKIMRSFKVKIMSEFIVIFVSREKQPGFGNITSIVGKVSRK